MIILLDIYLNYKNAFPKISLLVYFFQTNQININNLK